MSKASGMPRHRVTDVSGELSGYFIISLGGALLSLLVLPLLFVMRHERQLARVLLGALLLPAGFLAFLGWEIFSPAPIPFLQPLFFAPGALIIAALFWSYRTAPRSAS